MSKNFTPQPNRKPEVEKEEKSVEKVTTAEVVSETDKVALPIVEEKPVVEPVVATTPSVAEVKKVEGLGSDTYIAQRLTAEQLKIYRSLKTTGKTSISSIVAYIEDVKPGIPQTDMVKLAAKQVAFYNAIVALLNNAGTQFGPSLTLLLSLFHTHRKGTLDTPYLLRAAEQMNLSKADLKLYQNLTVGILFTLADPSSRKNNIRFVNFRKALFDVGGVTKLTDQAKDSLITFFSH